MVATTGITSVVVALAAWAYASTPATTPSTANAIPPQVVVSSQHPYLLSLKGCSQFSHRWGCGTIVLIRGA